MRNVLAVIVARRGSRGVAGKNCCLLHGRPVVEYSMDYLRATGIPMRLAVSTDDDQVARVAERCGIEVTARPAELATDKSLSGEAFRDAVMVLEERWRWSSEVAVFLQANVPIRPPGLIERGCEILMSTEADSVTPVIGHNYHPLHSVRLEPGGWIDRWMGIPPPRRQDLPAVYNYGGGCWIVRSTSLRTAVRAEHDPHWMFGRRVIGLPYDMTEFAEIDEPGDLKWAEFLLDRRLQRMNVADSDRSAIPC